MSDQCAQAWKFVPLGFHLTTRLSTQAVHLIDEAGQATIQARDEILVFLTQRLAS